MTPTLREQVALKPCPFCGGEAVVNERSLDERSGYGSTASVRCSDCGARGRNCDSPRDKNGWVAGKGGEARTAAITAWNTRAMLSALQPGRGE